MADGVNAEFRVGDALAVDESDGSFDVVRSERMLQWLPDLQAGFDELGAGPRRPQPPLRGRHGLADPHRRPP